LNSIELVKQIEAVKAGDNEAFTLLVEKYQNIVLGYAFSKLGDFHKAQDVVQESFIIAHSQINQLEKLEAFPGWLKGIVNRRCHRVFRSKSEKWLPLEEHDENPESSQNIEHDFQKHQEGIHLQKAVKSLPENLRTVITLYYLEERSQKDVATFLDLPPSKVNNYLYEARAMLKGRLLEMANDTFKEQRLSEEFAKNIGEIINIQGPVVETKMKKSEQPSVFDVLGSKTERDNPASDLIVVQRLKDGKFRCISTEDEVHNKGKLYNSGNYDKAIKSLKEERISEAVKFIKNGGEVKFLETGIKAIDLLCPMSTYSSVGIFGKEGVGRAVLVMELLKRKRELKGNLSLFFYVDIWNALGTQDMLETEPYFATDINENIQTAWIVHPKAGDPEYAKAADYIDVRLFFSPLKSIRNLWPAIDPVYSESSFLNPKIVGEKHYEIAVKVKEVLKKYHNLMIDPVFLEHIAMGAREKAVEQHENFTNKKVLNLNEEDLLTVKRGMRLEKFLTQPFYVAEEFSGMKGVTVSLEETIDGASRILNGEFDDSDLDDLTWKGSI
jgi:RNA polymerase sigma factor (sigma-70 family)